MLNLRFIKIALLSSLFVVLTACGGGGDSTPAPAAVGSAEWIAEQQEVLDEGASISAFDDAMFDAITACDIVGTIDDATEIACVQAALDAIDPPTTI